MRLPESIIDTIMMACMCSQRPFEVSAIKIIVVLQDLAPGQLLGTYNGEVCLQSEYNDSRAYDLTRGDNLKDDKTKDLWSKDSRPPSRKCSIG